MHFFQKTWVRITGGIILALLILLSACYFSFPPAKTVTWGINYSPDYMRYLGFDPVQSFSDILTQLHPQKVRLTAYWEDLEPQFNRFDFTLTDQLLAVAEQNHVPVLLVVGKKQPRWPECHTPAWYNQLPASQQDQAVLDMLNIVVQHFRQSSAVERWQVENEPFFDYGQNCPVSTPEQMAREVALVRSLDSRPVVVTDSGEKGWWFNAANLSDIFGSTMYRKVNNPKYGGYITYPLPPLYYRLHAGAVRLFTRAKTVIGVELQAEPWLNQDIHDMPVDQQKALMNPQIFQQYTAYAKAAGFSEDYLWGAEWWYWLKNAKGDSSMWQAAEQLFSH